MSLILNDINWVGNAVHGRRGWHEGRRRIRRDQRRRQYRTSCRHWQCRLELRLRLLELLLLRLLELRLLELWLLLLLLELRLLRRLELRLLRRLELRLLELLLLLLKLLLRRRLLLLLLWSIPDSEERARRASGGHGNANLKTRLRIDDANLLPTEAASRELNAERLLRRGSVCERLQRCGVEER